MWVYQQTTGKMFHHENLIATGYSGNGPGLNNPDSGGGVPPIECGDYKMGAMFDSDAHGRYVIPLQSKESPRSYYIRGYDYTATGNAYRNNKVGSDGDIILVRQARKTIGKSSDKDLLVIV